MIVSALRLRDVPHAPLVLLPWGRVLVVDYSRMCCSDLVPVVDCAAVLGRVDPVTKILITVTKVYCIHYTFPRAEADGGG